MHGKEKIMSKIVDFGSGKYVHLYCFEEMNEWRIEG
jgi:hypothetical protein